MDNELDMIRRMVIALNEIPGIGWHSIKKAVASRLWKEAVWTADHLTDIGLRPDQASAVAGRLGAGRWQFGDNPGASAIRAGAAVLTPYDAEYPDNLRHIAQPPWVLYAKGNLKLLQCHGIAIVGTRAPTAYGRHSARRLSAELSELGLTVISGLAKGIDGTAHEAALDGAGGTIAVLPTPIDTCYPPEHRSLFRSIAEKGLLITESPIGMKLHPGQFRQRNRIIAGLAAGTIVVEGELQSGSLITAEHAQQMDRELFAVPGPISSPKSKGPNQLIKRGFAKPIDCADDIFEELLWLRGAVAGNRKLLGKSGAVKAQEEIPLTSEELLIVGLLQVQPLSINELHELSAIPFGHLNALLINLCIKRKIELQPGSIYIAL